MAGENHSWDTRRMTGPRDGSRRSTIVSANGEARPHPGTNGDPRVLRGGRTTRDAQSTLASSPVFDLGTSRDTGYQQVYSPSDPDHSRMHHDTSQPNSKRSKRAKTLQPDHAIPSGPETFLISSHGSMMEFPGGIFGNKTLNTIFDEVSTLTSEHHLREIEFKLEDISKEEKVPRSSIIRRDTEGLFKMMIQRFRRFIEERKEAAGTELRVVLESKA